MKFKKALFIVVASIVLSLAICQYWKPVPYDEQLIRIQAEQQLGRIDKAIMNEPLEIQAMLLSYSENKELLLKAWISLSKYPNIARQIILRYGAEPEFIEILLNYGDSIIPVIQYFIEHDVWTIKAMVAATTGIESIKEAFLDLFGRVTGSIQPVSDTVISQKSTQLGPTERGWYAVNFIQQEGHDFLGQFVVDKEKNVKWNQTDRILKALTSFLTGGVKKLETKYDLGENISAVDVFWAGLDVAIVGGTLKVLRAGKAVTASRELSLTTRTRLIAPKLFEGRLFLKMGKYAAVAGTAYIVVTHPSLINSMFAEVAKLVGLSPWVVQFLGWSLIIILVLYPFSWLLIALVGFIRIVFSGLEFVRRKSSPKITSRSPDSISV